MTAPRQQVHDPCMAVKTITIDLEAYEVLARRKKPGESFSQVIKTHFGRRETAAEFMRLASGVQLSEKTLDAVTEQVRARRKNPARSPKL